MQSFDEAIKAGFKMDEDGNWSFKSGEYELCFERLLFNDQFYVALYKNHELLTNKVVIKPGK